MRLGIFAKTFPGTEPLPILSAAREAGYAAVQYNMACSGLGALPGDIPARAVAELGAAAAETGVAIAAVSATYNMIHPSRPVREAGRRGFAAVAQAARAMGTSLVTLCTGSRDPDDQWRYHLGNRSAAAWRDLLDEFAPVLDVAEDCDVDVGIEPEHANVVYSAERASALLAELRSPRLKIVLDPANLVEHAPPGEWPAIIEQAVYLLGGRIALAHAKDRAASGAVAAAGRGAVDFEYFFRALRRAGFDGPVVTHGLSAAEAADVALFLKAKLERSLTP